MVALTIGGLLVPLPALALAWLLAVVTEERTVGIATEMLLGLYDPLSAVPMVALTLLAMACFARMLFAPHASLTRPSARRGVYLCLLINLVYLAPILPLMYGPLSSSNPAASEQLAFVMALLAAMLVYVVGPVLILAGIEGYRRRPKWRGVGVALMEAGALAILAALVLVVLSALLAHNGLMPLYLGIFIVPIFWPLTANLTLAGFVFRHPVDARPRWLTPTIVGGGTALATASSFALILMHYSPTGPGSSPIHCFVASAAARGHRRWVRTQLMPSALGMIPVNDQLRVLIAAELAVKLAHPRLHRILRGVYNVVGPILARLVRTKLAADAVYVALKPVEALARIIVRRKLVDLYAFPLTTARCVTRRHIRS